MKCQHCNREIANKGSLVAHQMSCSQNPTRVKHFHSPDAHAKKGSVGWSRGMKIGRHPKWDQLFPNEAVFVENSTFHRHGVKKRIIEGKLIPYECALCFIGPMWYGKPMPLILDHINGINNDNRLENLRFVCSNCDSTLPTYKSRNRLRRSGRVV